jgi:hypothetical protein
MYTNVWQRLYFKTESSFKKDLILNTCQEKKKFNLIIHNSKGVPIPSLVRTCMYTNVWQRLCFNTESGLHTYIYIYIHIFDIYTIHTI